MAWVLDVRMPRPQSPAPSPRVATDCKRLAAVSALRRRGLLPRAGARCIADPSDPVAASIEFAEKRQEIFSGRVERSDTEFRVLEKKFNEALAEHAARLSAARARVADLEGELARCGTITREISRRQQDWRWHEADEKGAVALAGKLEVARREAEAAVTEPWSLRELRYKAMREARFHKATEEAARSVDTNSLDVAAAQTFTYAASRHLGLQEHRVECTCTRPAYAT
mmetsp:Transcript_122276/g.237783  ORF Transcript_122276/g.237783 Transcript_122276/m.237783 type:complete len:227 (-) Transcript_122276:195-875(-)